MTRRMGEGAYLYPECMTLPGRSRTIVVEPLRAPAKRPTPVKPPARPERVTPRREPARSR